MNTIGSADGTPIAFNRCRHRRCRDPSERSPWDCESARRGFTGMLTADFTAYTYDRRGDSSGAAAPSSVDRETDDLAAVITAAGGSAYACGASAGANLVLKAPRGGPGYRQARRLGTELPGRRQPSATTRRLRDVLA